MRRISGYVAPLVLAAALVASAAITGCTARASGTVKGASRTTTIDTGTGQAANNVQQNDGAHAGRK